MQNRCIPRATTTSASMLLGARGAAASTRRAAMLAPSVITKPEPRYLSRASPEEKSWGEIAADAARVAKTAVAKVADTAKSAVKGLLGAAPNKPAQQRQRRDSMLDQRREPEGLGLDLGRGGPFSGLLGRAVGSMVGGAVQALGRQMEAAARETQDVYSSAAQRIRDSAAVQARMGGPVQVGPAMSQSVSTSVINGVSSKRVVLLLPVYGADGRVAQAQVTAQGEGARGGRSDITVQLPDGSTLRVDGKAGGGKGGGFEQGEVIDAEFKDIKS